jgi:hypothetical protein
MADTYELLIEQPQSDTLVLTLTGPPGIYTETIPYHGHVDNILLTAVDNLLKRHTIDRFALRAVTAGPGIDKNSSLYRIVTSFGSAVSVASAIRR